MLEAKARLIHRTVGIYLVGFLALQMLSGLLIALGTLTNARDAIWFSVMGWIHFNWEPLGSVYRVILGTLGIAQGLGGVAIYLLMRARQTKAKT